MRGGIFSGNRRHKEPLSRAILYPLLTATESFSSRKSLQRARARLGLAVLRSAFLMHKSPSVIARPPHLSNGGGAGGRILVFEETTTGALERGEGAIWGFSNLGLLSLRPAFRWFRKRLFFVTRELHIAISQGGVGKNFRIAVLRTFVFFVSHCPPRSPGPMGKKFGNFLPRSSIIVLEGRRESGEKIKTKLGALKKSLPDQDFF